MKINIIKAWKDEEYRSTLTQDQLEEISNPAGSIELSDDEMSNVNGGIGSRRALCFTVDTSGSGDNDNTFNCCMIE